jgi:methenyltetrahydrofolate cyclohydrolase
VAKESGEMTSWTLSYFLEKLASAEAVPGGGSVAALSGALGASLLTMYCRIGLQQKNLDESSRELLQNTVSRASILQSELSGVITEDSIAFGEVMTAFQLPKSTEEEKKLRQESIQLAFHKAVEAPLQTLQKCVECVTLIPTVAHCGNPSAFSDLKVAQYLCHAGAKGAMENIDINLPYIKDPGFLNGVRGQVEQLHQQLQEAISKQVTKPGEP